MPILECVPNFSEGRDAGVIRELTDAIDRVDGARVLHVDSPSSTNPLGVRGVGEGGIIPVAAALANAVARAIDPARTGHEEALFSLPLRPERVLAACRRAGL